jgi:hypothetical protein
LRARLSASGITYSGSGRDPDPPRDLREQFSAHESCLSSLNGYSPSQPG